MLSGRKRAQAVDEFNLVLVILSEAKDLTGSVGLGSPTVLL